MKEKKEFRLSYWAAHLTTIVSVTLVLLMVGIIAAVTCAASRETRRLKEQIELSVVLGDSCSDAAADSLARRIAAMPFAASADAISRDDAMKQWSDDTGEDLEEVLGVNPFSPEVAVAIRADYASADSLKSVGSRLKALPHVQEVAVPDASMVESMNRNIRTLSYVLGAIAAVMLVISFVLINNTVHLAISARRFTIHTMQLVGATDSFIRRPFLTDNLLNGAISGAIASAILAGALAGARSAGMTEITRLVGWGAWGVISAGLIVAGMLICTLAALLATHRYLRADYDDLFKS